MLTCFESSLKELCPQVMKWDKSGTMNALKKAKIVNTVLSGMFMNNNASL